MPQLIVFFEVFLAKKRILPEQISKNTKQGKRMLSNPSKARKQNSRKRRDNFEVGSNWG
jgi:hypothetical protein